MEKAWLSIIIPVYKEGDAFVENLQALQVSRGKGVELIVARAQGDSCTPDTGELADIQVEAMPGRASQMNAGAGRAQGRLLLFLHADTRLPEGFEDTLFSLLEAGKVWGRFDVRLSGSRPEFRLIERMISWRSRFTGIATGDQALFVSRTLFGKVGGFPVQPLMEDIELCRRLIRLAGRPVCLKETVTTSSRKWEQEGIWRTVWLMWRLKLAYYRGASADVLAREYYGAR